MIHVFWWLCLYSIFFLEEKKEGMDQERWDLLTKHIIWNQPDFVKQINKIGVPWKESVVAVVDEQFAGRVG